MSAVNKPVFALILLLMTGLTQAASVSYFLDKSNVSLPEADFLKVTISDNANGSDIDFRVDVLRDAFPSPAANFGMQKFFFNYGEGLGVNAKNIVNIDPSTWTIREDKNAGGSFGKFEFALNGSGATRTEVLLFNIVSVDGDSIYDYAIGDSDNTGEFFAAHVAGFDAKGTTSGVFAGSTVVPIPAALWLLSPALLGLIGFSRRHQ